MIRISEIRPGVKGLKFQAVISKKEIRSFSNKPGNYLELEFSDSTGKISGKKWDNIENADSLQSGDVVELTGDISEYRGQAQITVQSMKKITDFDPADFIASYGKNEIEDSISSIITLISQINDKYIRQLTELFIKDKDYFSLFRKAPAAKGYHHNRIGGLAVHTLGVMRLCVTICDLYNINGIEKDLLIAGALFHDIGKVSEYEYGTKIDITDKGRLLGHISIGLVYVSELISNIKGFPENTADILKHLILSHHGEYEWGSPKRPKTLGAQILHFADNMDSKIEGIRMLVQEGEKNKNTWSSNYDGRPFLVTFPDSYNENNNEQELF